MHYRGLKFRLIIQSLLASFAKFQSSYWYTNAFIMIKDFATIADD